MDKETSSRVSTIASHVFTHFRLNPDHNSMTLSRPDAEALAGSCMSQDETPGQVPVHAPTFRERLEIEREELRTRFNRLGAFIQGGCPGVTDDEQIDLLKTQHAIMEQYLRVLTLRTGKLAPVGAVASAKEVGIGEAVETGGHDEDRDGPIPFGG